MNTKEILGRVQRREISPEQGLVLVRAAQLEAQARPPAPAPTAEPLVVTDTVSAGDIAIVGIAARFPGAPTADAYWRVIDGGRETVGDIAVQRWPGESGRAGLLEGIDRFDARFFHVSPREAELMDPQHRLFLQQAWTALEDAGYAPQTLERRRCGVFVGCGSGDYLSLLRSAGVAPEAYSLTGNMADVLAARLSYCLNLTGPVMSVQTACSSSLVATHLACESLRRGESDVALVGGVALMTAFESYRALLATGMLSSDGVCRAFGDRANGFVPAEGVAAIVLKPLAAAVADGDHIYGVIKGCGINYDGRTNGITAPSAPSQTALEVDVYRRFGIDPETISYVEAHGTGTKLGDPIEVAALTDAFRQFTRRTHFCAIGSAKSNIGHAMAASGLAGLIKVLFSIRNRRLAPWLHVDRLNEHIDFANSPFYVCREGREWTAPAGLPRRAAVSSFGMSGTNAHLVVEEYVEPPRAPAAVGPHAVVLSARDPERLRRSASALADHLAAYPDVRLADVAYTLQVGRDAMKSRLAFVASSVDELREKLTRAVLASDAATDSIVSRWLDGETIVWSETAAAAGGRRRVPLPTSPFAEQSYWVPGVHLATTTATTDRPHPLVDREPSTMDPLLFRARLRAAEPCLRDHVIAGHRTLPGVAYLEIAREAAAAAGIAGVGSITNIVWTRPLTVDDENRDVEIRLRRDGDRLTFEARTDEGLHAQGRLVCRQPPPNLVDLAAVRARCRKTLDRDELYERLEAFGLRYGSTFRTVQSIAVGSDEALTELRADADGRYTLNPGLLDGALHGIAALAEASDEAAMPWSLGEIEILAPTPDHGFAHVVRSGARRFDITLTDPAGRVLVRLKDFVMRAFGREEAEPPLVCRETWTRSPAAAAGRLAQPVLLFDLDPSRWQRLHTEHGVDAILVTPHDRFVAFGDRHYGLRPADGDDYRELRRRLSDARLEPATVAHFWAQGPEHDLDVQLERGLASVLHLSRLLVERPAPLLFLHAAGCPAYSAVRAFLRSVRLEHPRFRARTIALVNADEATAAIVAEGPSIAADESRVDEVRYADGARWVRRLEEWQPAHSSVALRAGGVCVIAGGAGGIGRIVADHLVNSVGARVVLAGRSAPETFAAAPGIEYVQADVTRREDVERLIIGTRTRYGAIHGVIHAAGVLRDGLMLRKSWSDVEAVIAPKIRGCVNLDEATREDDLDFFAMFSSISAVFGNKGQSDYAFANCFLNDFAAARGGPTVAIAWPLWRDGGMKVDPAVQRGWLEATGMEALSRDAGLAAFVQLATANEPCPIVIGGRRRRLRAALGLERAPVSFERAAADSQRVAPRQADVPVADLAPAVHRDLARLAAAVLKVDAAEFDADADVSEYGFDSITFTELATRINEAFGCDVTPADFFEHTSLGAFVAFLCRDHRDHLERHYAAAAPDARRPAAAVVAPAAPRSAIALASSRRAALSRDRDDAIAIVGISGVMPQCADLDEFWRRLDAGDNLIQEVPADRWDWRAIYGDPAEDRRKTRAKWGGFMPDADKFDHLFFGISPKAAELMDPQQRLVLESVWKAIEDAGHRATDLAGTRTGVFIGVASSDYCELIRACDEAPDAHVTTGISHSFLVNRVSYLLDLRGPSEPIDTACSSALVAIHRAVEAIRSGSCDMAIAGGVNVMASSTLSLSFSNAGMLCDDGQCKTFDKRADGYVRGEGVGAALLKPLGRALADGDHIYGLVLGSAENHGGHAASMTAPNPTGQAAVLVDAYERADVDPSTVSYIEAHGTGTSLGDPIEINGLKRAFAELATRRGVAPPVSTCGLGSVKTNVGHLEAASGMASLFKVLLAMRHGAIPASLHFSDLNPYIHLDGSPFSLVVAKQPWIRKAGAPRRAGISSFGIGGANAHVVLEDFEAPAPLGSVDERPQLFVLSAKTADRLRAYAGAMVRFLAEAPPPLDAMAYTSWVGRVPMDERVAVVASSVDELRAALARFCDGEVGVPGLSVGSAAGGSVAKRLLQGAAGAALLDAAIRDRDLATLAELWVAGADVDGSRLHAGTPERVSLPTYPFARVRHWVGGAVVAPIVAVARAAVVAPSVAEPMAAAAASFDVEAYLIELVAREAKVPASDIRADQPLEKYGIDSMMIVALTRELERVYGELSKSLLFEFQTIDALAGHLRTLRPVTRPASEPVAQKPPTPAPVVQPEPRAKGRAAVDADEDIAIIGVSGRYPMARDLDEFWQNLRAGRDGITEIPRDRWDYRRYYDPVKGKPDRISSKWGGFLDDVDKFDPLFFNISPKEAELMDPQERLFLETAWHTLEDAGYGRASLWDRKVGVYVGVMYGEYQLFGAEELLRGRVVTARSTYASLANRISYFLNFHGPSLAVDTMCSSSLTAIHLACESLRRGESEVALAGGVNVSLHPLKYFQLSQGRFASSEGKCRAFGDGGDGYVPGEGVGAVLLKPLDRAVADGDRIHAVIKGSSINHGGKTNGYTVPNPVSQAAVIAETFEKSGVDPATVSYVEAHGTGTSLGDPIEIAALTKAFGGNSRNEPCAIGSVKSNIGHLESAAGIAGLTKVLLQLRHDEIAPSLHADPPNVHINFEQTPFRVQRTVAPWRRQGDGVRRAGISSFGAGGSNAHLILEEYAPAPVRRPAPVSEVIVLSARTPEQLQTCARRLADAIDRVDRLDDLAFTLQTGREALGTRLAFVARSLDEARDQLRRFVRDASVRIDGDGPQQELARRWVAGGDVDWQALRAGERPRRIGLPLYPFARERYWIPSPSFEVTLGGSEFFLRDHIVAGQTMLPGVMYLEFVRRAVGHAAVRVTDLVWLQPFVVAAEEKTLRVEIHQDGGDASFDVRSGDRLHAQGRVSASELDPPKVVDVHALRARCGRTVSGEAHYARLAERGLRYGASMRALRVLHAGAGEVLAELVRPESLEPADTAALDPSILDGALHAVAGLALDADAGVTYVPYAIGEIAVYAELPARCFAYARASNGAFDVDVLDEAGRVLVSIRNFQVRPLPASRVAPVSPPRTAVAGDTLYFRPVWTPSDVAPALAPSGPVLLLDTDENRAEQLRARWHVPVELVTPANADEVMARLRADGAGPTQVVHLWSADRSGNRAGDLAAAQQTGVYSLLRLIQTLPSPPAVLYVHAGDPSDAGIGAFCRSVRQEQPAFAFKTVALDDWSRAVDVVTAEVGALDGSDVKYAGGRRFVRSLEELPAPDGASPLRRGGVYLITGGGGGIGRIVAEHLTQQWDARVVVAGRSTPDRVVDTYIRADVTSRDEVRALVAEVKQRFGALHGVIHCAGVLRDGLVHHKREQDVAAVIAPKVLGAMHLAEATRDDDLDCFVVFSSIAGVFGNVGQAGYAYANAVADALGPRVRSINWPLWQDGGMRPDDRRAEWLRDTFGFVPLDRASGIRAFEAALASGERQVVVLHGDVAKIRRTVAAAQPAAAPAASARPAANLAAPLAAVEKLVKDLLARELKLPLASIQPHEPFERYGIDSVAILNITTALEETFGALPKTLLYEHETVRDLADHLAGHGGAPVRAEREEPVVEIERPAAPSLPDAVAIVGLAGRYPGAEDLDEFWRKLVSGTDCVTEIPASRWDHRISGPARWGGFLADIDMFDAAAFHISPREASCMDPQERLFMQAAWHALEDAGYSRAAVEHREVGVYVGVMWGDYQLYGPDQADAGNPLVPESSFSSIANRVSFFFNLHGPSLAIDTMCSSSLTALHLAIEALRRGECEMAIAGGVNLSLHPQKYGQLNQGHFLASDGRCRSFGAGGDGYVPGEGVGALVLKPLARAVADGDHVYAVVRGSSINHGGRTTGYTVPNPNAQAALIGRAFERSGVDPASISYVEAHGTGTSLGDPIEIVALAKAFGRASSEICAIGSVKSNIGHLESASGIAGVTKVLLQMRHAQLVPSLHAETLNPHINFDDTPFRVQRDLAPWPASAGAPRRAGVSSFGAGGSNAHVILEEFPQPASIASDGPCLVPLSAADETRLNELVDRLLVFLARRDDAISLERVAYTLQVGRQMMAARVAVVATSLADLEQKLRRFRSGSADDADVNRGSGPVAEAYAPLVEGAAGDAFLRVILEQRDLAKLARLWASGVTFDWNLLYPTGRPRRMSLPLYPFEKKRCWFDIAPRRDRQPVVVALPAAALAVEAVTPEIRPGKIALQDLSAFAANLPPSSPIDRPIPPVTVESRAIDHAPQVPARETMPSASVRDLILRELARVILMEPGEIDPLRPFMELGIDSVLGVELIRQINVELGLEIDATKLYDYPTVEHLAAYVAAQVETAPRAEPAAHVAPASHVEAPTRVDTASHVETEPLVEVAPRIPASRPQPVAIVGMSGRFPGADGLPAFWKNLREGVCSVTDAPSDRWSIDRYYDRDPRAPGKTSCKSGAFLADADKFDARFFNISPADADVMDPQQRIFLETAWAALEDAGYSDRMLNGHRCGAYIGVMGNEYLSLVGDDRPAQAMLGNSTSILPARIAYVLNLKGPVMALDTACSSSLVAIHTACGTLRSGDADLMLAGGVTLYLTEKPYICMSKGGMLSPDGLCKTFDDGANGFVPGEGVGVVVLKLLDRAIADGDPIHGVILGSGVNQDGRTNGLTAPSADSQRDLEIQIYERFGINPEAISYVEAHGTGTKLGDPIEVDALTQAFRRFTDRAGWCRLGSVKTNVGHTSAAAGVAGLIKVLLSMRHHELPPTLHFSRPNTHIRFDGSPFRVNTSLTPWREDAPLCAAVSSFGFSGTNSHLVVQEPPQELRPRVASRSPHVFVLSAKTAERLEAAARRLIEYLDTSENLPSLDAIAYTLQVGRTVMEHRLAIVAADVLELRERLERFLAGDAPDESVFTGSGATLGPVPGRLAPERMAQRWATGVEVDWAARYDGRPPRRVPLPTYPFARDRHWATPPADDRGRETFRGDEFFLVDHIVGGRRVVPGAMYLELARARAEALGGRTVRRLSDVMWVKPLEVSNGPRMLDFSFEPAPDGLQFKAGGYCHGRIGFDAELPAEGPVDINAIRKRCSSVIERDAWYARLTERGLAYGPSFQTVRRVECGDGEIFAVVARHDAAQGHAYVLHPSSVDGALQTVAALVGEGSYLPSSIREVTIAGSVPELCFVHARAAGGDEQTRRFDLDLLDEVGHIVVSIRDFALRAVGGGSGGGETAYYRRTWKTAPDVVAASASAPALLAGPVVVLDTDDSRRRLIEARLGVPVELITPVDAARIGDRLRALATAPACIVHLWSHEQSGEDLDRQLDRSAYALLAIAQALPAPPPVLCVHDGDPASTAMAAFCRTLRQEQPRFSFKTVALDDWSGLVEVVAEEIRSLDGAEVKYADGGRWVRQLEEVARPALSPRLRRGGVYLISGGAGGLGRIVADYLRREWDARVVAAGRSDAAAIDGVHYVRADVTSADDVRRLVKEVKERFGAIDGVIHAAGVLRDGLVRAKTAADVAAVLGPKIRGGLNLFEATRHEPLGCFVVFSSIAGVLGNAGQADYAYANAFLDRLAEQHHGRMMSIGWPLWRDGGMGVAPQIGTLLESLGLQPLETSAGLDAFVRVLGADDPHPIVLRGQRATLERIVAGRAASRAASHAPAAPGRDLAPTVERELLEAASAILKMPIVDLDPEKELTHYGVDSIGFMEIATHLHERYGVDVAPTVVFEFPSLRALARHLCDAHREVLDPRYPPAFVEPAVAAPPAALPLSFGQRALWFLHRIDPDSAAYNVSFHARVKSPLDVAALRRALRKLAERHEVLRAAFPLRGGEPVHEIGETAEIPLTVIDASGWTDAEIHTAARQQYLQPFDLDRGPAMRAHVFSRSSADHVLLVTIHHIAIDAWSLWIISDDLAAIYRAETTRTAVALPPVERHHRDFVRWQREMIEGPAGAAHWDYWRTQLAPPLAPLDLQTDRPRPRVRSGRGASVVFALSESLSRDLNERARQYGVTPFVVLLSGLYACLHRYTDADDIVIGSPLSGRTQSEFSRVVGYMANPVVLRGDLSGDPTSAELYARVRRVVLDAIAHQDYPFPLLVERLQPERDPDPGRSPIFQVCFAFQNVPNPAGALQAGEIDWGGLRLSPFTMSQQEGQFDLLLDMMQVGGVFTAQLAYDPDRFDAETIERMADHLRATLEGMAGAPEQRVSALPLLSEAERSRMLDDWNATARPYPLDEPLHRLIGLSAVRHADHVAVEYGAQQLTYAELESRANRVANHLHSLGVCHGAIVGVCFRRSLDMIVALCGVLKAGAAYLPLDPDAPRGRLAFMVKDARCPVVVTEETHAKMFDGFEAEVLCLDRDWPVIELFESDPPATDVSPDDCAYVVYTSGTTGKPKGVMNTHLGITNRLLGMQDAFPLTPADRVLQKTPYTFDVSVPEVFGTLMAGATLVMAPPDAHRDGAQLVDLVERARITSIHFVPSMLRRWLEEARLDRCRSLRRVMCSGEELPLAVHDRFFERFVDVQLLNMYGPTETAVECTAFVCERGADYRSVPIGRPMANTEMYVVDRHLQPVPRGAVGQLYIGGACVARGYLNRPDLTAEKFVPHPFRPSGRLYKSGDLGRFLPDGTLEFLGRIDQQVKIRGVRIEPAEIECVLNEHPQVGGSAVVAMTLRSDDKELVAYYVPEGEPPSPQALRAHLSESLPESMIPAVFVALPRLPLTANGKLDRAALPTPDLAPRASASAPARGPIETKLAAIWADVLRSDPVGRDDNFFALGGHSLLATQVVSRVRDVFHIDLRVVDLFDAPSVAALAARIETTVSANTAPAPAGDPSADLVGPHAPNERALSFAQERLWFLAQLNPRSTSYNVPFVLRITGRLDVEALERAISHVIARHDALRSNIATVDGRPALVVAPERRLRIERLEAADETEARTMIEARALEPFDLRSDPLIRATFVARGRDAAVLLVVMHHVVCDAWSLGVFLREVAAVYSGKTLPPLAIQYAEVAARQRRALSGAALERELDFWKRQLEGAPTTMTLTTGRPHTVSPGDEAGVVHVSLDGELTAGLRRLSREAACSIFMPLFAAFAALLRHHGASDDMLIATPVAGRHRQESEALIGLFVNTVALRANLTGNPSFADLLMRVRQTALAAYEHQDVPFEQVVAAVKPDRSVAGLPLAQAMFSLQNAPMTPVNFAGLSVEPMAVDHTLATFDLTLELTETDAGLTGAFEYRAELFDRSTIERMARELQSLIRTVVQDPRQRLGDLALDGPPVAAAVFSTAQPLALVQDAIADAASRWPDSVAIVAGTEQWTYGELERRARDIASRLQADGVRRGESVAYLATSAPESIAALLGILKAGAVYVPLDPDAPGERRAFIQRDAGARLFAGSTDASARAVEAVPVSAEDDAYIIYTSGSTGRPKGVVVTHGALARHCAEMVRVYGLDRSDRVLQWSALCFDASLEQMLPALMAGATLVLRQGPAWTPAAFSRRANETGLTVADVPPGYWHELLRAWSEHPASAPAVPLRLAIVGGDVLAPETVGLWRRTPRSARRLLNVYGPTEAAISATAYEVPAGGEMGRVPIGQALPGRRVYIVDESGQSAPVGVEGELCIGGPCLARGYLNQPELTSAAFVADPFAGDRGARMYRTGDRARWRSDGQIEFLGRRDRQVKVRGYRIELDEMESVLAASPDVAECAVTAGVDAAGDAEIVAHVVGRHDAAKLRAHLSARLPSYMQPSIISFVEALPRTSGGKVDRRQLAASREASREVTGHAGAPSGDIDARLARIWCEVLDRPSIGAAENFFDIGGHSLLAVRLLARIEQEFGRDLPLGAFLQHPTMEHQAGLLLAPAREDNRAARHIVFRADGSKAPFFCVHPIAESVIAYRDLAREMQADRPIHAIHSANLDEASATATVEALAAAYLDVVAEVQPAGPYYLGGWSAGGVVAFEMARQLEARGARVAALVLIDSFLPGEIPVSADAEEVLWLAHAPQGADARHTLDVGRRLERLLAPYVAETYGGRVLLIRAADSAPHPSPDAGWGKVLAVEPRTLVVPGHHYSMLRAPHVAACAAALAEFLDSPHTPRNTTVLQEIR